VNPFIDIQLNIQGTVVNVQYKVDPLFDGRAPYKFTLSAYQDETLSSSIYTINSTTFFISDDTKTRQNQLPSFLYTLTLTTADNKTYTSPFFGWGVNDSSTRNKYLSASEISRRERVRFNYAGLFAYILRRQAYSAAATGDVDPITGEALVDNTASFGTGVMGGYYPAMLTRLSVEGKETKTDYSPDGRGVQYVELLKVRSAGFPFIDQHDIIVLKNDKRYIVTEANSTYFPGTTMILIQQPMLRLVPNTDTIYSIGVPPFPKDE
jgi:hypothetical protein